MYKVYWNSIRKNWSILVKNRVAFRLETLLLEKCKFVVNENQRLRVIKEQKKNVHAFVVGSPTISTKINLDKMERVCYNPYLGPNFIVLSSKTPIKNANYVYFDHDGKAYVK